MSYLDSIFSKSNEAFEKFDQNEIKQNTKKKKKIYTIKMVINISCSFL